MSTQEDAYSFCPYLNLHKPHLALLFESIWPHPIGLKCHFMYYVIHQLVDYL